MIINDIKTLNRVIKEKKFSEITVQKFGKKRGSDFTRTSDISQTILKRVQTSGPITHPLHSQLQIRLPITLRVKILKIKSKWIGFFKEADPSGQTQGQAGLA